MSLFIEPLLNQMVATLKARTPALCTQANIPKFNDYNISWTGQLVNPPSVYVLCGDMIFDPDAETNESETWICLLRASFTAPTPDEKVRMGLRYAKLLKDTVKASFPMFPQFGGASDWDALSSEGIGVKKIFVPNLGLQGLARKTNDGFVMGYVDVPVAISAEEMA